MQQYENIQLATILSHPSFHRKFEYSTTLCARSSTPFLHPSLIFGYSSSYFTECCVQTPLSHTSIPFTVIIFVCSPTIAMIRTSFLPQSPLHISPSVAFFLFSLLPFTTTTHICLMLHSSHSSFSLFCKPLCCPSIPHLLLDLRLPEIPVEGERGRRGLQG